MLTQLALPKDWTTHGWTVVPPVPGLVVRTGDAICINHPVPHKIHTYDLVSEIGFIIADGWDKYPYMGVVNNIYKFHTETPKTVSLFRRIPKKKEYIPSFWAKPVPLP